MRASWPSRGRLRRVPAARQRARGPWHPRSMGRLIALAIVLGGRSEAPASAPDAGTTLAAPAAPVLTPCPAGWRELRDAHGVATCDPWPETSHADCAADEVHWPGAPGCARIGTDCPP